MKKLDSKGVSQGELTIRYTGERITSVAEVGGNQLLNTLTYDGDSIEAMAWTMASSSDFSVTTAYTYESGRLARSVKTTKSGGESQTETVDYVYEGNQLARLDRASSVGSTFSNSTTFLYEQDLLTSAKVRDANGMLRRTTHYTYDDRRRLWKVTKEGSHVETYEYADDRVTRVLDGNSTMYTYAYEAGEVLGLVPSLDGLDHLFDLGGKIIPFDGKRPTSEIFFLQVQW